jgi:hypothetical protein
MIRASTYLALLVAGSGGCLSVPDNEAPMCESTSDCDSASGEVCEQGVCWGNPPAGTFAAVIAPPSARHDLVPSELPQLALPRDGWMGSIALDKAVQLGGRIVAYCAPPMTGCDPTPLGATITVSRHSQFQGGPGFQTVVNVEAGAESFAIPLPATRTRDDAYTVTIVPDATPPVAGGPSAAERVPPLRTQISVTATTTKAIELGGPGLPMVTGKLTNALGQALDNYRVVAIGRWDPTEAPAEVSTIAYTDSMGRYALTLSADLVDKVELVARPKAGPSLPTVYAPTIRLAGVDATASSVHDVALPATLGKPIAVPVEVQGAEINGELSSVLGASVSVTGTVAGPAATFTYTDTQVVGMDRAAHLNLLDGASMVASYRYSITPPASSTAGAVYDQPFTLPLKGPFQLRSRVAMRGEIRDAAGKLVKNAAVTARPSLRFLWSLEPGPQQFLEAIPAATGATDDNGVFAVWVDGGIGAVRGSYDLLIEPPVSSLAPTYTSAATIPADPTLTTLALGRIDLPSAAYVHGQLNDGRGQPVANAELKLYAVSTRLDLCSQVAHAPSSCPIPAVIQGRSTSDATGTVRIVLPRIAP